MKKKILLINTLVMITILAIISPLSLAKKENTTLAVEESNKEVVIDNAESSSTNTYNYDSDNSNEINDSKIEDTKAQIAQTDFIAESINVKDNKYNKVDRASIDTNYKIDMNISNKPFVPFVKVFGGTKNEHLYETIRDGDEYITVGETYSTNINLQETPSKGENDMLFIKSDNEGNIIWKKTFGGSQLDYSTDIIKDVNGGYTVAGWGKSTNYDFSSQPAKNVDGRLIRLSDNGDVLWSKTIGGYNQEHIQSILQTSDKGYLCVGMTNSHLPYGTSSDRDEIDGYIVKLDQYGNIKKETRYGTKARENFSEIVEMDDGNYLVAGTQTANTMAGTTYGKLDGVLLKVNPNGDIIWSKHYGGSQDDLFRTIDRTDDGHYVITGYTFSTDKQLENVNKKYNEQEGWILKIDSNGNIIWQTTFGGTGTDYFLGCESIEGGFIVSGFSNAKNGDLTGLNNGAEDAVIVRYSNDGQKIWVRTFGGSGNERLRSICSTPGGGYLITGDTYSNDGPVSGMAKGASDGLIVKFDNDGSTTLKNYDTLLDKADYKIEGISRTETKLLSEGTFTNQTIQRNQTITKTLDFKVPNDKTLLEIKITLTLQDSKDSDNSNNEIVIKIPVVSKALDTDFAMVNGKLSDENGTEYDEFLPSKNHVFEFSIKNQSGRPFIFTFGGSGKEHFEKHIKTNDGGFLAVGRTNSSDRDLRIHGNKGNFDALIVKYNYKGDVEWSDTFAGSGLDFFYHAVQTQDGNYVVVGTTASTNGDAYGLGINEGPIMVKYSQNGTILWKKGFSGGAKDGGRFLFILEDDYGNLYTASEEISYSSQDYTGAVYRKHDRNGTELWRYCVSTYSKPWSSNAYGLTLMENGDVLGCGRDTNTVQSGPTRGNYEPYIIRLRGSDGAFMWRRNLYGAKSDDFRQVVECNDGITLLAIGRNMSYDGSFIGSYNTDDSNSLDTHLVKLNKNTGEIINFKFIGGYGHDNARYLEKLDNGYLISGNTDRASGDFKGLTIRGGHDAIWFKMDDNLNINWIGKISGSGDDATQAGLKVGNGFYVVSGETSSRDGNFYGLYNGGEQDAFIAKLDKDGELVTGEHDENISQIDYKIEAVYKSGIIKVLKEGSFFNEEVPMESTITKKVGFTTPEDTDIEKLVLTASLSDIQDTNEKNNSISVEYNMSPIIGQDFLVDGYNIKNNKNEATAKLELGKKYSFNTKIRNKGVYSNKKITLDNILDTLTYKVTVWDGINENSKRVLSSGTKKNTRLDFESSIWNTVNFTIPEDRSLNEVILELGISDKNDMITTNNTLKVKLPIYYEIENDVGIKDDKDDKTDGITIYPVGDNNTSTTTDDCYVEYGAPTNIKAIVGSTNIRTQNLKATLVVNNKEVETKTVYGVSSDMPGAVYFNYTVDERKGVSWENLKIQVKVSPNINIKEDFKNEEIYKNISDPIYVKVIKSCNPTTENTYATNSTTKGLAIGESVAYIKVKKLDRDKKHYYEHKEGEECQKLENENRICPGHTEYIYDENAKPYDAFIPVDTIKLENITQNYKITDIRYKSKYTKENINSDDIKDILHSKDGFINILDRYGKITNSTQNQIKIKAGYGFELQVDTKYDNNLPEIYEKVRLSNNAIKETAWSKYQNYPGTNIKVLYNDIDKEVNKYKEAIGIAVPSINDIAIHNLSNLYIKTPHKTKYFLEVEDGLKNTTEDEKYKISNDKTLYEIERTFKIVSKTNESVEKYYVDKEVKNGDYELEIFTPRAGIGAICDMKIPKLKDTKTFDIKVYGGYFDDVKTHLNE